MKTLTLVLAFVVLGYQVSFQQDTIGNFQHLTHAENVQNSDFHIQTLWVDSEYFKQRNPVPFNDYLPQQKLKKPLAEAQIKINSYPIFVSIGVCLVLFFVLGWRYTLPKRGNFLLKTTELQTQGSEQKTTPSLSKEELDWLKQLDAYIKTHIADVNLTAEGMADGVCVSRAQLFRRVKKLTGLTPHDYLNEVRFNYARQCLENRTYTSVKSVSYAVGMKHLSHFSHQFKLRFGKCPSEYFI